jgi:hypothetical protein
MKSRRALLFVLTCGAALAGVQAEAQLSLARDAQSGSSRPTIAPVLAEVTPCTSATSWWRSATRLAWARP